MRTDVGMMMV